MGLDLVNHEALARLGVKQFWTGRSSALSSDESKSQGGERAGVLSGKNMDGFLTMIDRLVRQNGLSNAEVHTAGRPLLTLPGFFRPTKLWDIIVMDGKRLVAAIELKSHVGSFGNNFNNRTEEAIGTAHDLWTAIRDNVLGDQPRPFLGWLMLVEDGPGSRCLTRSTAKHFKVFPEFVAPKLENAPRPKNGKEPPPLLVSYLDRYEILCRRLMNENLYDRACLMTSSREAAVDGAYGEMSTTTNLTAFVAGLAGHVATWAAQRP
jgi:hypothetical protein